MIARRQPLTAHGICVGVALAVRVAPAVLDLLEKVLVPGLEAVVAHVVADVGEVARGLVHEMRVVPGDAAASLPGVLQFAFKHAR